MRTLAGVLGAIVGLIVGFLGALLFTFKVTGDDDFGAAMLCIITIPVGLLAGAILGVNLAERTLRYLQRGDLGVAARRKKTLLIVGLAVCIPSLVVGMFHAMDHHDDPPSDQQMLANFQRHETTFNQIVRMAYADKRLTRVGYDWTIPDDPLSIGIPHSRINQYRMLFGVTGTTGGFWADTGTVQFDYWGHGSAISSDTDKGYVYTKKVPAPLLPTLDGCHPTGRNMMLSYRHIEGNWYLYYKYLPD